MIRQLLIIISIALFTIQVYAQREFKMTEGDTTFVMKRYVFMLLNEGPDRTQDSITSANIQKGHMAHLNKLSETGKLQVAGPFEKGGIHRGLLIFDVETMEEAIQLEAEDPAIKSRRLKMETMYWWGAKGTCLK